MNSIGRDNLTFCDICGREILCDDEVGDIVKNHPEMDDRKKRKSL